MRRSRDDFKVQPPTMVNNQNSGEQVIVQNRNVLFKKQPEKEDRKIYS